MRTRVLVGMAIIGAMGGACLGTDANDIKAEFLTRAGVLQNVMVIYDVNSVVTPTQSERDRAAAENAKVWPDAFVRAGEGQYATRNRFCRLDGRTRYESRTGGMPSSEVYTIADGVREELVGYDDDTRFTAQITTMAYPPGDAIDEPLGMRIGKNWIDAAFLARCDAKTIGRGQAELTLPVGSTAYNRWVLDADKGYVPILYESIRKGNLVHRSVMSDLRRVGDVWMPYKAVAVTYDTERDGKRFECIRREFTVKSITLGSPENTPESYHIEWPDKILVVNTATREVFVSDGGTLRRTGRDSGDNASPAVQVEQPTK